MNNEPVAWMSQGGDVSRSADYFEEMGFKDLIPLYTHPSEHELGIAEAIGFDKGYKAATPKELTNDEIMAVAMETSISYKNWGYYSIDFARAILKKASEK